MLHPPLRLARIAIAQVVLREQSCVDLVLRGGIVAQHGGDLRVGFDHLHVDGGQSAGGPDSFCLLDNFHFCLLAEEAKLMPRIADAAANVDTAFFRDAIVLLIDTDDLGFHKVIPNGLFVPLRLVEGYDGRAGTIWTLENGRLGKRQVALGARLLDERIQVLSGLPEGVAAVIEDTSLLREGRAARAAGANGR